MPKNTPVKRASFAGSTLLAYSERVKLLSQNAGIKMADLFDEAFRELLFRHAKKEGITMMNEQEQPKELKHVIGIANHKGGVGKTTTTAALAYLFAKKDDMKVLLIDADAQANLTQTMEVTSDGQRDIRTAILAKIANQPIPIQTFIMPTQYKDIDMIPGNYSIEGEAFMSQIHHAKMELDINPWQEILEEIRQLNIYDVILVDTHPSIGADAFLPMQACDEIVIPLEDSEKSVSGLFQVYKNIINCRRRANPNIRLLGYFFNKVIQNTSSAKEYIPSAREAIPAQIKEMNGGVEEGICFNTTIRNGADVKKSDNLHCAVTERFHNSKVSKDFEKLFEEIKEAMA